MLARMSAGIAVLAMTASFAIGAAGTASASPEIRHERPMRPPATTHRPPNLGAINNNLILIRDNGGNPNPALQDDGDDGDDDDDDLDHLLGDEDPDETRLANRQRELAAQIRDLRTEVTTLTQAFLNSEAGEDAGDQIGREDVIRVQQIDEVTEAYNAMMAAAAAANKVNDGAGDGIAQAAAAYRDKALFNIDDEYMFAVDSILDYEMELHDPESLDKYTELQLKIQTAEQEQFEVTNKLDKMAGIIPDK